MFQTRCPSWDDLFLKSFTQNVFLRKLGRKSQLLFLCIFKKLHFWEPSVSWPLDQRGSICQGAAGAGSLPLREGETGAAAGGTAGAGHGVGQHGRSPAAPGKVSREGPVTGSELDRESGSPDKSVVMRQVWGRVEFAVEDGVQRQTPWSSHSPVIAKRGRSVEESLKSSQKIRSEVFLKELQDWWLSSSIISLLPVRSSPTRTSQPSVKPLLAHLPLVLSGDGAPGSPQPGTTTRRSWRDAEPAVGISLAISATTFSVELPSAWRLQRTTCKNRESNGTPCTTVQERLWNGRLPMEIQSVTGKLKHKWQYTCEGGSDCTVAQVALKLPIYSLHAYGKKHMTVAKSSFGLKF